MKHLKFLAAVCCMAAVFAACEKNDPSQNDGNSNTGSDNATGTANGHEWVDLGLPSGTKWAICNVGASKPEEYGNYYAWGETTPKDYYDWSTYKWCNGSKTTLTKYNTSSSYGTVDNKTVLAATDDAAHVNWGAPWRMPADAAWTELFNNCRLEWTDDYNGTGVAGLIGKSKINGNSIFLPAAGFRSNDDLYSAGRNGYYWSSSLDTDDPYDAWSAFISSGSVTGLDRVRYDGHPVRPVFK